MTHYEHQFTSTGSKLIHHPEVTHRLNKEGKATPISLQVAPTSRCQLKCAFCSNANRKEHEDLDLLEIIELITQLKEHGLKTVEWTGGGDPTMYHSIWTAILIAHEFGLEQGFITNGLLLHKMEKSILDMLSWIRISMNCLDYVSQVKLPRIKGVLGFSYVMNEKTTADILHNLNDHVRCYGPEYVRIVPNCQATVEQQIDNNRKYSELVRDWGYPYFYQAKNFESPERCWWGYFKPFVLHDRSVFRCSSVVLNPGSEFTFHRRFKWCDMSELPSKYEKPIEPYIPENCQHCVFKGQNDLVDGIIHKNGLENFI
jgi:organic radical activating enzyme